MKYSLTSRLLHWIMAALILFLLGLGIYMTEFLSKEAPNRMEIYSLHKSLGVMVLVLVFVRIINRLIYKAPALPSTMARWEVKAANFVHFILYILMILVPLSGYLMSNSYGYPVHFFSIELPKIIATDLSKAGIFAEIHKIAAYSLIGVLVLHILGVIKHMFFDKPEHNVLPRML